MDRNYLYPAFLAIVIFSLSSCYNDNYEDLYKNFPKDSCNTTLLSYSDDIKPILTANCAISGCHAGSNPQSGLNLSQYPDVKTIADDGRLTGRITGTTGSIMPPDGSLPSCELEKIKAWVDDGAKNN